MALVGNRHGRGRRERRRNDPAFDVAGALFRMSGVDLTVLEGIDPNTALVLMSEIGPDVSRFPTVKLFCSWLGLAPQHQMSAGKIRKRRVQGGASRASWDDDKLQLTGGKGGCRTCRERRGRTVFTTAQEAPDGTVVPDQPAGTLPPVRRGSRTGRRGRREGRHGLPRDDASKINTAARNRAY